MSGASPGICTGCPTAWCRRQTLGPQADGLTSGVAAHRATPYSFDMSRRETRPRIRTATAADGAAFIALVRGLAAFEELPPPDDDAAARLLEHAFGPEPRFGLRVVELGSELVAYAVFFETYSTFVGRPSLFLEDLFVRADVRGRGIGKSLLVHLAKLAVERDCGRFEWSVLDWNETAQTFYRSLGARILPEWKLCRVDGDALMDLAEVTEVAELADLLR